jgi:hypothetical protein
MIDLVHGDPFHRKTIGMVDLLPAVSRNFGLLVSLWGIERDPDFLGCRC